MIIGSGPLKKAVKKLSICKEVKIVAKGPDVRGPVKSEILRTIFVEAGESMIRAGGIKDACEHHLVIGLKDHGYDAAFSAGMGAGVRNECFVKASVRPQPGHISLNVPVYIMKEAAD